MGWPRLTRDIMRQMKEMGIFIKGGELKKIEKHEEDKSESPVAVETKTNDGVEMIVKIKLSDPNYERVHEICEGRSQSISECFSDAISHAIENEFI